MKIIFAGISAIAILASCGGGNQNPFSSQDSTAEVNQAVEESTLCFRRLQGTENQDTTTLKLQFEGERVSGIFNHIPSEKDSRRGTIEGNRDGDIIKANWYYMQEGMNDTLAVEFKLLGGELLQKTWAFDEKTGREVITDTSTYSIKFEKTNCE